MLSDVVQYQLHFAVRVIEDVIGRILRLPANLLSSLSLQHTPRKYGQ